jgi:hypothetical protein
LDRIERMPEASDWKRPRIRIAWSRLIAVFAASNAASSYE